MSAKNNVLALLNDILRNGADKTTQASPLVSAGLVVVEATIREGLVDKLEEPTVAPTSIKMAKSDIEVAQAVLRKMQNNPKVGKVTRVEAKQAALQLDAAMAFLNRLESPVFKSGPIGSGEVQIEQFDEAFGK